MNQDNLSSLTQNVIAELRAAGVSGAELNMARRRCQELLRPLNDNEYLFAGDYVLDQLKLEFGMNGTSNREASDHADVKRFLSEIPQENNRKKGFAFWSRGGRGKEGE